MKLFNTKSFYDCYLEKIFIATLLFYVFSSFFMKIFIFFHKVHLVLPALAISKFLFLLFLFLILLLNFKRKRQLFIYTGLLSLVFIAGNFNFDPDDFSIYYLNESVLSMNFSYFLKYLYPFFFIGVFSLIKNKQESISNYFEILEKLLIFNTVFIFLGFIFSINFFQSYMHTIRFGYSGIIDRTFFLYLLIIVISRRLFLDKVDLKFIIFSLASLFIGTKSVVLFFGILLFYFLYEKRKMKLLYSYSAFLLFLLFFIKPIIDFFTKFFPYWQPLLNKHGYLTLITSTRNWTIHNTIEYIKVNGTLKNLFFGGLDFSGNFVEMDLIDLFLLFGIIGTSIYILFLSKIINKKYHLIPFIVAFFSGDFLFSTIIISTCFIWMYETYKVKDRDILNESLLC